MRQDERGFQLLELMVALAVFIVLLSLAAPPILRLSGEMRLRLAAEEVVAAMRIARSTAVLRCANVALKFRPRTDGRSTWALYRDGDGDGVLSKDIDKGVDPQIAPPRRLEQIGDRVRFGFPPGRPARDPGNPSARLRRGDDPIRFNSSDLASFGPLGTATPGSVYLTDGSGALAAVRVNGRTGKMTVIVYDFNKEVWK
jgi:type II secretory pathway pseudopilin PulG